MAERENDIAQIKEDDVDGGLDHSGELVDLSSRL
jgi:hypothetical protein